MSETVKIKGGEKLEAALAKIASKASLTATLRVGFLEGATYPSGPRKALKSAKAASLKRRKKSTPAVGAAGGVTVPMVAALNEFGTAKIPARPFFRNMVAEKSPEWPKAIAALLKKSDYDVIKTLRLTGEAIKGQLQQSIIDTNSPPNAPSTIARKGFDKPLVETGHMLNSVDYEVKT